MSEPAEGKPCPCPSKTAFESKRRAEKALGRTWRKPRQSGPLPTRSYRCPCGMWHLTSAPYRRKGKAA
jgi:hypothetical protein